MHTQEFSFEKTCGTMGVGVSVETSLDLQFPNYSILYTSLASLLPKHLPIDIYIERSMILTDRLVNPTTGSSTGFTVEIQYIANSMCYFEVPLESYNLP